MKKLFLLILLFSLGVSMGFAQAAKTRFAIVGLDHDHVWGRMPTLLKTPDAELVAVSDTHPELIAKAKALVPASVKFFSDYTEMLDQMKPEAVIVTTANNQHLAILRACAQRHIHYFTEKPMAASGADAREMARVAKEAGIKLMVNYWNTWSPATQEAAARLKAGELGPIQKIIAEFGHEGPKEIGASKEFAAWLYDPKKNGAGALMDFACYGAELGNVDEGTAGARLCLFTQAQDGSAQRSRGRRSGLARVRGRDRHPDALLGLALRQGPGGVLRPQGEFSGDGRWIALSSGP